jgi:pyridoxal phosphate enzyme (YggS family)
VNVDGIRERIARAARAAGRDPAGVRLVAVTKTATVDQIAALLAAGVVEIGENRAQQLVARAAELAGAADPDPAAVRPVWHMVGRLQRNKVAALARWVTWWESIDRSDLVAPLARHAPGARVLVQVNVDADPAKGGCPPERTGALVDELRTAGVAVEGLMTVPRLEGDPRPAFAALRAIGERLGLAELSMGMTDDFEVAIAEGATMVRVGRGLFVDPPGDRSAPDGGG